MKICKTILIWIWLVAGLFVLSGLADKISAQEVDSAQPTRDRAALRALTTRLQAKLLAGRGEVYQQLRSNDRLPNRILNTHPGVELISVDERGHPRYYSVTNVDAAATISTDDVWPGGSGGFSVDGSGATSGRLGVWDGGGVRLSLSMRNKLSSHRGIWWFLPSTSIIGAESPCAAALGRVPDAQAPCDAGVCV